MAPLVAVVAVKINAYAEAHLEVDIDVPALLNAHKDLYWQFTELDKLDEPQLWERPSMFIDWVLRNAYYDTGGINLTGVTEDRWSSGEIDDWSFVWSKQNFDDLARTLPWVTQQPSAEDLARRPNRYDVPLLSEAAAVDTTTTPQALPEGRK